jgi:hypothetical protein
VAWNLLGSKKATSYGGMAAKTPSENQAFGWELPFRAVALFTELGKIQMTRVHFLSSLISFNLWNSP